MERAPAAHPPHETVLAVVVPRCDHPDFIKTVFGASPGALQELLPSSTVTIYGDKEVLYASRDSVMIRKLAERTNHECRYITLDHRDLS